MSLHRACCCDEEDPCPTVCTIYPDLLLASIPGGWVVEYVSSGGATVAVCGGTMPASVAGMSKAPPSSCDWSQNPAGPICSTGPTGLFAQWSSNHLYCVGSIWTYDLLLRVGFPGITTTYAHVTFRFQKSGGGPPMGTYFLALVIPEGDPSPPNINVISEPTQAVIA